MSERPERRRRWRFQFSLAALISLVIFVNLGFAIYYTWELYRFPPPIRRFKGHTKLVWKTAFSPDSRRLLSSSSDNTIRLWDIESGKEIRKLIGAKWGATAMTFSPDGRRALTGGVDSTVRLWDLTTGKEIRQFAGYKEPVQSVALSPDGRMAIAGGAVSTSVFVWDVETGRQLRKFKLCGTGSLSGAQHVAFSSDGRRALAAGFSMSRASIAGSYFTIQVWEIKSGREMIRLVGEKLDEMPAGRDAWVLPLAFSPDGWRALMVETKFGDLALWDLKDNRKIRDLIGHKGEVTSAAFSADGKLVMSNGVDRTFRVWDVESGREIRRIGTRHYITTFSPDGRYAVPVALDGTIKLWDLHHKPNLWPFVLAVTLTAIFVVFVAVMKFYVRSGERATMLAVAEWMRARRRKKR